MKRLLYISIPLIAVLIFSCSRKETPDIFSRVEGYMEKYPDSALWLLGRIEHPEELCGKQQADYALLLTQARDKNFLDSLQSDSLIELAMNYYRNSDDKVRAGKALFYYGKVIYLQKDKVEVAMQALLDAQKKVENANEYKLKAFIQEYTGYLNEDRQMPDRAFENYRKAVDYYQKAGDSLGMVYIYRNLAWLYEQRKNRDSVSWYLTEGLSILQGDSASPIYPSLMQLCGVMEGNRGNYSEAANCYLKAIRHEQIPDLTIYYYLSLGDVYLKLGQLDKAEECFYSQLQSGDTHALSSTYYYLCQLEKQRAQYAKALSYKELSDSLLQIVKKEELRDKILGLQQKYETEKIQLEKELLQRGMIIQLLIGAVLFAALFWSALLFYRTMKQRLKSDYERRIKEYTRTNKELIVANEQLIGKYICQIEELKQRENEVVDSFKEQIATLEHEMQALIEQNRVILENSYLDGINVLKQLKGGLLVVENMTAEEKTHLFSYIDLLFENFATRLCGEYGLNEANLLLAIFIKLGFTSEELLIAFDSEQEALRKRKQRLKSKIGLNAKTNIDVFLAIYPRKMSS